MVFAVQRRDDFFAGYFDLGGCLQLVWAKILQDDHELIAAQARHRIAFANTVSEALCNFPQEQIALVVAQGVVQYLEVVQIDKEQSAMAATPCAAVN